MSVFTYITEQNGQEYETMCETQHQYAKIHSKIEHLKQLRVSKRQHTNAHNALKYTAEHRWTHCVKSLECACFARFCVACCKRTSYVRAKLNRNTNSLGIFFFFKIEHLQNKTKTFKRINLTMTKLTKEIALSSMFHKNMMPIMSMTIIAIIILTMSAVNKSNESKMNVEMNTAIMADTSWMTASFQIVKYCS